MIQHEVTLQDRYLDRARPALGKEHRFVCTCGWRADWKPYDEAIKQFCPNHEAAEVH
jgi:hypothetical protein